MELLSRARNNSDFWRLILIALVLVILPFSNYSHAASWQPFAAGGAGWEVCYRSASSNADFYRYNGVVRLSYSPTDASTGQWSHCASYDGPWSSTGTRIGVATASSTFIGDGKTHSIGGGWSYTYNNLNSRKQDSAYFSFNGSDRLAYNYTAGQWWHKGIDWSKIGDSGLNGWFIGDGDWHSITDGSTWCYKYNGSNAMKQDSAWFAHGSSLNIRLAYNYTEGQWWHTGLDWSKLGTKGISSTFIGDGTSHAIGNGWSYQYNLQNAMRQWSAWFSFGLNFRLAYNYMEYQWWHNGIDWSKLGSAGLSSTFIGDGADHSIGSGWSYTCNLSNTMKQDSAWFRLDGMRSFAYNYTAGQWWHYIKGGNRPGFQILGSDQMSSAFIGDGLDHRIHTRDNIQYCYRKYDYRGNDDYVGFILDPATYGLDLKISYDSGEWWIADRAAAENWFHTGWETWEYIGDHKHLGHDYVYYDLLGVKQTSPVSVAIYSPSVECTIWERSGYEPQKIATWRIYNPGTNMKWDGGKLNVLFISTGVPQGFGEYTLDDVIVFDQFNLADVGISKVTESLRYINQAYNKQIDNLGLHDHGNWTMGRFGNEVSVDNYLNYENDFKQWNNYLTDNAQMQLFTCSVGASPNLLRAIAGWTVTHIFAHDHELHLWNTFPWPLVNLFYPKQSPYIWNYNTVWVSPMSGADEKFEFKTGGGNVDPCFFDWETGPTSSW